MEVGRWVHVSLGKYNDWTIVPKLFHATMLVGRRPTDNLRSYAMCVLLVYAYVIKSC